MSDGAVTVVGERGVLGLRSPHISQAALPENRQGLFSRFPSKLGHLVCFLIVLVAYLYYSTSPILKDLYC